MIQIPDSKPDEIEMVITGFTYEENNHEMQALQVNYLVRMSPRNNRRQLIKQAVMDWVDNNHKVILSIAPDANS